MVLKIMINNYIQKYFFTNLQMYLSSTYFFSRILFSLNDIFFYKNTQFFLSWVFNRWTNRYTVSRSESFFEFYQILRNNMRVLTPILYRRAKTNYMVKSIVSIEQTVFCDDDKICRSSLLHFWVFS